MASPQTRGVAAESDLVLARTAARGDRDAAAELVRRASGVVGDLLRRMGAGDALADDITQDALVVALGSLAGYRGEAAFATWTTRIAARLYMKRRSREARYELMAEPIGPDSAGPSEETSSMNRLDLDRALSRLSPPERLCVSLCHGAGLTHDEIALALSTPLGTVKSHVTRGLQKLRVLMTAEPAGSDADE
ncbi:RNA polymerase sigma factor [Phenylobacterium sp.]|uniref:RNA polymerase sigma factor n=1 Tax=Phenylobacterium sp. TaxID=1871053 RepID=UPI00356B1E59